MSETLQDVKNKLVNTGSTAVENGVTLTNVVSSHDVAKAFVQNPGTSSTDPTSVFQTGTALVNVPAGVIYGNGKTTGVPQYVQFKDAGSETFGNNTLPAVDVVETNYNGVVRDQGTFAVLSFGTDAAGHSFAILGQPNPGIPGQPNLILVSDQNFLPGTTDNGGTTAGDGTQLVLKSDPSQTVFTKGFAAPCFAAGSRLVTPSGETAVEALRPGDTVRSVDGDAVIDLPVIWVGHRTVNLATHSAPWMVRPVCIKRDAFAPGAPARDLRVSPDHAIAVDGVLVPARLLVNNASIVIDEAVSTVTYYHVELDRHAVLLAEGLPAESYLDTGNRSQFENGGAAVALRADFSVESRRAAPGETCLPLCVDAASVRPIWSMLAERAGARGLPVTGVETTADAAVRVLAGGAVLATETDGATMRCAIPAGVTEVTIASRASRPAEVRPWLDDRRMLGVAVAGVMVDSATVALDDASLASGWWSVETDGATAWRWTDGAARLALPVATVPRMLVLSLHATGEYLVDMKARVAA